MKSFTNLNEHSYSSFTLQIFSETTIVIGLFWKIDHIVMREINRISMSMLM